MALPANQTYLEGFVEAVGSLPAELQRLLNTIKEIDDRSQNILASVRERTQFCLGLPPQSSRKASPEQISEVVGVREEIEKEQQLLIQLANEKVQLATQCWEMVDGHLHKLNEDLGEFEQELKAQEKIEYPLASPSAADMMPQMDWGPERERERRRPAHAQQAQQAAHHLQQQQLQLQQHHQHHQQQLHHHQLAPQPGMKRERERSGLDRDILRGVAAERQLDELLPPMKMHQPKKKERMQLGPSMGGGGAAGGRDADVLVSPGEPTYCFCHRVSFGEMIGCDNPNCQIEWFHIECVGITSEVLRSTKEKWYCPDCTALKRRGALRLRPREAVAQIKGVTVPAATWAACPVGSPPAPGKTAAASDVAVPSRLQPGPESRCLADGGTPVAAEVWRAAGHPGITVVFGVALRKEGSGAEAVVPADLHQVSAMLTSLRLVGLLGDPEGLGVRLHVVVSVGTLMEGGTGVNGTVVDEAVARLRGAVGPDAGNVVWSSHPRNDFEYPAIHTVWRLACEDPSRLYLYLHNKGLRHAKARRARRAQAEMGLFREVVAGWRAVAGLFAHYGDRVQHAGIAPGTSNGTSDVRILKDLYPSGWQWFTFFWARGSYLAANAEPVLTHRRHYYEMWMSVESSREGGDCPAGGAPTSLIDPVHGRAEGEGARCRGQRAVDMALDLTSCRVGETSLPPRAAMNALWLAEREFQADLREYMRIRARIGARGLLRPAVLCEWLGYRHGRPRGVDTRDLRTAVADPDPKARRLDRPAPWAAPAGGVWGGEGRLGRGARRAARVAELLHHVHGRGTTGPGPPPGGAASPAGSGGRGPGGGREGAVSVGSVRIRGGG